MKNVLGAGLLVVAFASSSFAGKDVRNPVRPFDKLQGDWISAAYKKALEQTRSPLAAAKRAHPIAVVFEDGDLKINLFHEATWRRVKGVDDGVLHLSPNEDPEGAEEPVHYTLRDLTLRFRPAGGEPEETFERIDEPVETFARRVLVAGRYRDAKGGLWTFEQGGALLRPGDRWATHYEVSLDTSEACCDYIRTGNGADAKDWIGFKWVNGKLELRQVFIDKKGCPISCRRNPFAVLTPIPEPQVNLPYRSMIAGTKSFLIDVRIDEDRNRATIVQRHALHGRCVIDDGLFSDVDTWISNDGELVAFELFSGSEAAFKVFTTNDCRERAHVNTYGRRVEIDGTTIRYRGACELATPTSGRCNAATVWQLEKDGTLREREAESRALTKEEFGVEFRGRAELEGIGTPAVHIVRR